MARLLGGAVLALAAVLAQERAGLTQELAPTKTVVTYDDVGPVWHLLRPHLPSTLAGTQPGELAAAWREWARAHDADVRARVARGDEDSLVNLWLFGTSFTELPPARARDVTLHGSGVTLEAIAEQRLDALLHAAASPATNDRVRWVAQFLRDRAIDPQTSNGRSRARDLLAGAWKRVLAEQADFSRVLRAPNPGGDPVAWMARYGDLYRERGLSADTSFLSSFAIDSMLMLLVESGRITAPVQRIAVVGPGLDFMNKADGHDFYPEQTIQPFAVIDSLLRLGLAQLEDVSVTTFDVSARVNQHIADSRARARTGAPYVIHLPLPEGERWDQAVIAYWESIGARIGEPVRAAPAPAGVRVRAVRIRPEVINRITPVDLNVVVERLERDRFDLVIATNVFIYYDAFQQALAMRNIGQMLRPGGSLLSNQAVGVVPPMRPAIGHDAVVYSDRQFDYLFWYQRE